MSFLFRVFSCLVMSCLVLSSLVLCRLVLYCVVLSCLVVVLSCLGNDVLEGPPTITPLPFISFFAVTELLVSWTSSTLCVSRRLFFPPSPHTPNHPPTALSSSLSQPLVVYHLLLYSSPLPLPFIVYCLFSSYPGSPFHCVLLCLNLIHLPPISNPVLPY